MDGSSDWASMLLVIIILSSFLLNFTDIPQRMQLWRFASFIRKRLVQLDALEEDTRRKAIKYLKDLNVKNPKEVIDNFINNFFLIMPVSMEPTDIIRRLKHLIRLRDTNIKSYINEHLKGIEENKKENAEVLLEITSVITQVNKIIKHYFKLGLKNNNWILVMQLALELPVIMRLMAAYHKAMEAFAKGTPVGDGAGPMVVRSFIQSSEPRELVNDTHVYESEYKGRKLYIIKAKGPGATVGWPGEAVEKLVDELKGKVDRIITIDAALKLESEETGEVAHGVGAAIGDIGPEKIAIERAAAKHSIPLEAVVVKMSEADAINTMTKQVYEGVKKAINVVRNIIESKVKEGGTVILVGIGNTVGIM